MTDLQLRLHAWFRSDFVVRAFKLWSVIGWLAQTD